MEDKQYVVTPEMVYGADWMQKHAEELEKWEWEFRPWKVGDLALSAHETWDPIRMNWNSSDCTPRIILLRRKLPPAPQLREQYGVDRVEIPADKEWTGEFRASDSPVCWLGTDGLAWKTQRSVLPRLILRDRTPPTRVWFKAEEKERYAREGDWIWLPARGWALVVQKWCSGSGETTFSYLCATRHEEPDLTPTVVTQADVDAAWARQQGGGK